MHYKTLNKLKTATKIYSVEPEKDKVIEVKIQLPTKEYVQIDLNLPFPNSINYISLENGGFNYDPETDVPIIHNHAKETIRKLKKSFDYRSNSNETINKLILLIESISPNI